MQIRYLLGLAIVAMPLASFGDTIFSDTFGTSGLNTAAGTPTSSATTYETWTQGAPGTLSIATGDFHFQTSSTVSVLGELQAQFPSTTLVNVGDFVQLDITFNNTANVLVAGQNANATLNVGLFNSGGVAPNTGAGNLSTAGTTGGAQNWVGYAGRMFLNGNATIYNRKAQTVGTSTSSQNQDLLFNNASSSAAFNSPNGTTITTAGGTGNSAAGLTAGAVGASSASVYTLDYKITLSAAGTETITSELFNGTTPTGTPIFNTTGSATGANNLSSTFDSLAFGFRQNNSIAGTSESSSLDISALTVNIETTPEPTTMALAGLGAAGMLLARRWKARK
jgi:PEP-CTERM motif